MTLLNDDPGKYSETCDKIRAETNATGVCLLVFDGKYGNGFEVQLPSHILMQLPDILEMMAKDIRKDLAVKLLQERICNE